jgi:hypothetical protein
LRAIASELDEREDGLVDLAGRPGAAELPSPRLLGPFEPVLMGWTSRTPLLGAHEAAAVTVNGLFRPFALVGGRGIATWRMRGSELVLVPFGRLARADQRALDEDAADVLRFFAGDV